ncbi:RHH-type rel operon transcriptional repressor/antitoxin RelB [Murinocardiopsis flavida]|uniref:RHH-type rel operon transcriptional repressor/antitoxin RelB n=1 Tax=Murinocardiopsis flavida TaxID=645275 RepID=A0A2P8DMX1_9ACTN|nr:DUF6290 family protein [Murinocardiopsis flavida]PSK98555.1 RHH-type rel operon transcriptional repressor/antitoxin RelB [Murinocardiopsis flavida]
MLTVRFPDAIEERLAVLARETGRSKSYYVRELVANNLDDMEDVYLAEREVEDLRAGRTRSIPLDEAMAEYDLED